MKRPGFTIIEKQSNASFLVVDKEGLIGDALVKMLRHDAFVAYLGKNSKRFPTVPENRYSAIFVVDDERKIGRKLLPKLAEKARFDDTYVIFIVQRKDLDNNYLQKLLDDNPVIKIVILGDIVEKETYDGFITEALKKGRIDIEGDGLSSTYPLFLEDAILGILEAAFGANESFRVFYLFPKHPPTQLSLARIIKKAYPEIKIDFGKAKKIRDIKITVPFHGKYLLDDNYDFQNRIRSVFLEKEKNHEGIKEDGDSMISKNKFSALPLIGFLSLVIVLLLPVILTIFFSFAGFWTLDKAIHSLYKGDLAKAKIQIQLSHSLFLIADKTLVPLVAEAKTIDKESEVEGFVEEVFAGRDTSLAGVYLVESLDRLVKVLGKDTEDARSDFMLAASRFRESMVLLKKAQAEELIQDFDPLVRLLSNADALPVIFGFEGQKTYLVIFQDDMELRPTGGNIESYGLLTINNGAVDNFSTHDVYEADSKLKGHIEPPFPIRRHLSQEHWYLRDSNFDIDFVKSASKSAFFLDVELDEDVDGVIAIDRYFIEKLLSVFNEKKEGFLRESFGSVLRVVSSRKDLPYMSLVRFLSDSLVEKHILLAFSDLDIQKFFTVNSYSSSLWDRGLQEENVINDFVGVNEANLGNNKINYQVERKISNDVSIDDKGVVSANLVIVYDNGVEHGIVGGGDYKNYLRTILDDEVQILSISIDGEEQKVVDSITDPAIYESKNFIEPYGLEVERTTENGKSVFGFLINVESGERQVVSIKYSLPQAIFLDKPSFSYSLDFFKQPGTKTYPFKLSVSYPLEFVPVGITSEFENRRKISLTEKINSDKEIRVRFSKR